MTKDKLFYDISHCEEFTKAYDDTTHVCNKIVASQQFDSIGKCQVPEPWNGDIEKAQILFISSNPSFNREESYPTVDGQVELEFYEKRFIYPEQWKHTRYWNAIAKWASAILQVSSDNVLQEYVAITELVHCKSKEQVGVGKCCTLCADKWLEKVLSLFHGQYVVLVGKTYAWKYKVRVEQLSNGKVVIMSYAPRAQKKNKLQFILQQLNTQK